MTGEGDEDLLDDEQTSKDNALNIPRVLSAVDEDVEVVAQPVEAPAQQGVRMDYHGQKVPKNSSNAKPKIILCTVLALAVLACCYFFLGGKKSTTTDASAPSTEKLGDVKSESVSSSALDKPITRENRDEGSDERTGGKSTVRKDKTPSKADEAIQEKLQKAAGKDNKKPSEAGKEGSKNSPSAQTDDPNSASKPNVGQSDKRKEKGFNALKEQVKETAPAPKVDKKKQSKNKEVGIPVWQNDGRVDKNTLYILLTFPYLCHDFVGFSIDLWLHNPTDSVGIPCVVTENTI